MLGRIIAIAFIYVSTSAAWVILSTTVFVRSETQDSSLRGKVSQLWGRPQTQASPTIYFETPRTNEERVINGSVTNCHLKVQMVRTDVPLQSSHLDAGLSLDYRQKGLLWYSTYRVQFVGHYVFSNETDTAQALRFAFPFPAENAVFDNFRVTVNGHGMDRLDIRSGEVLQAVPLAAGAAGTVEVAYVSQGLDRWSYTFGDQVRQVKNFALHMTTDFERIDFPQDTISPTRRTPLAGGWALDWEYANLLTGVKIGMDLPHKLNPGPWAGAVTMAAPVSLGLFFFMLFLLTTLRSIRLHPMNYFFLGAAFFSFHLLLAYLVDHISIHAAFAICSVVSILLVTTYMRLVVGNRFAFVETALAQLVYLVLFSYTFFFEGYTGLAITVLCILTLFVAMQFTGRLRWDDIFRKPPAAPPALR